MAGREVEIIPPSRGRPSKYSQELADRICELVEEGLTVRAISGMDDMPDWRTIRRWLRSKQEFCLQYVRAREVSADAFEADILDRMVSISDPLDAQVAKVQIDTLKWIMGRRAPKVYGSDKFLTDRTGSDEDKSDETMTVRFVKAKAKQDDGDQPT